jgi:hypothetical protein
MDKVTTNEPSSNRDPITGAPGAHPIGVGIGAAAGGIAAGAAAGTLAAGPVGTAVGAAVGAVVGGLTGKAVAEHYDPRSRNSTGAVTSTGNRITGVAQALMTTLRRTGSAARHAVGTATGLLMMSKTTWRRSIRLPGVNRLWNGTPRGLRQEPPGCASTDSSAMPSQTGKACIAPWPRLLPTRNARN